MEADQPSKRPLKKTLVEQKVGDDPAQQEEPVQEEQSFEIVD